MTQDLLNGILVAVLATSITVNGWFLRQAWAEIISLRKSRHEHANKLTEHEFRLKFLERGAH